MDMGTHGPWIDAALGRGWITEAQAVAAAAATGAASARAGLALVRVGLSEAQVHALLAALGRVVVGCARCRRCWVADGASATGAVCPGDGTPLVRVVTLEVVGELPASVGGAVDVEARTLPLPPPAGTLTLPMPPPGEARGRPLPSPPDETRTRPVPSSHPSGTHPAAPAAHAGDALEVRQELGRGGFGAVYAAHDGRLNRDVAMKVLLERRDAQDELRFLEEARVTGQLEHPNIVPVHALGTRGDGHAFFTMKLVRGQSLADLLKEHAAGRASPSLGRYLEVFAKVLDAVAFAHARGVIHRDLKPANIMIGEFGEVLVMDWGLAKVSGRADASSSGVVRSLRAGSAEGDWSMAGAAVGTPAYMSPEQLDGQADERSDVYALGAILYELLTLRRAFLGTGAQLMTRVAKGEYVDPERADPARPVPPELAAVVRKALDPEPERRYPAASALRAEVDAFLEGRAVSARRDPLLVRAVKWARRHRSATAAAGVGLVAAALFVVNTWALPATLVIDRSACPAGTTVTVNGATPPDGAGAVSTLSVWFPGLTLVEARAADHAGFSQIERLVSRATVVVRPTLARDLGLLTINSKIGELVVTAAEGAPDPLVGFTAPFEKKVPTGRYRLTVSRPGYFPLEREVTVERAGSVELRADLEPVVSRTFDVPGSVCAVRVHDVDGDGQDDLLVATGDALLALDPATQRVLWRRPVKGWVDGRAMVEVADVDADGRLEVIFQDGRRVHVLDASTGEPEAGFLQPSCLLRALDIDGDGVAEVVCATAYTGVSAFRADAARAGQRVWSAATPRRTDLSPLVTVPVGDDGREGLVLTTLEPRALVIVDARDGRALWRRDFAGVRVPRIAVLTPRHTGGQIVVAEGTRVRALDAADGRLRWSAELPAPVAGVGAAQLSGEALAVAWTPRGDLACFDADGRPRWSVRLPADRTPTRSGTGDLDGDGQEEWLIVGLSPDKDSTLFALDLATGRTKVALELELELEKGRSLPLGEPTVVTVDREPRVLLAFPDRIELVQAAPPAARDPDGTWWWAADVDGDGRAERVEVRWPEGGPDLVGVRVRRAGREAGAFEPVRVAGVKELSGVRLADVDGDGALDLVMAGTSLVAVSLPGLRRLIDFPTGELRFAAPALVPLGQRTGLACFVKQPEQRVRVIEVGDAPAGVERCSWEWNGRDGPPVVLPGPVVVHAGGDLRAPTVEGRDATTGARRWVTPVGELVGLGGLLAHEGEVLVGGVLGGALRLRADGREVWARRRVLESDVCWLTTRRGPQGVEVVLVGSVDELAVLDVVTGALRGRARLPARTGSAHATAHDVDGDGVDELLLVTPDRAFLALDGQTLRLRGRWRSAVDAGPRAVWALPPQVLDVDGDDREDVLLQGRTGMAVLLDLARWWALTPDPSLDGGALVVGRLLDDVRAGRAPAALDLDLLASALDRAPWVLEERGASPAERRACVAHLRSAVAARPSLADGLLARAERRAAHGDEAGATECLRAAATLFPLRADVRARMTADAEAHAMAWHRAFDRIRPMQLLEQALEVADGGRLRGLLAGLLQERANDGVGAEAQFERAVAAADDDLPWALAQRARWRLGRGEVDGAAADVARALALAPEDGGALAVAGLLAVRRGDRASGLALIERALALGLDDPLRQLIAWVTATRVELLCGARRAPEAVAAHADRWRRLGPQAAQSAQHVEALNVSRWLIQGGHLDDAEGLLAQSAVLATGDERAQARRLLAGTRALRASRGLRPRLAAEWLVAARAAMFGGRREEAGRALDAALAAAEPGARADVLSAAGRVHLDHGRPEDAVALLEQALAARAGGAGAATDGLALARARVEAKDDAGALAALRAARAAGASDEDALDEGLAALVARAPR